MELSANTRFTLTLDSKELRLIIASLYGGLKDQQKEEALALQKRLVDTRAVVLTHMANEAKKYANNLEGG